MIKIKNFIRFLCIAIFLVSLYFILDILVFSSLKTKNDVQDVKEVYYENPSNSVNEKLEDLRKINPDICGWIKIDDTNIDYPVLFNPDDTDYYLLHNYKKEDSRYGSITVDARCTDSVKNKNVILHGHHMKDGQMFADLLKFDDFNFCKKHPLIQFDTTDSTAKWKIFSVFKTNTLPEQGEIFDYCVTDFKNKNEFNEYVKEVKKRSIIDYPTDVKYTDQLLTLSTCSYEYKDFRTVVVARKLRRNEAEDSGKDKIKLAGEPLMPECWDK